MGTLHLRSFALSLQIGRRDYIDPAQDELDDDEGGGAAAVGSASRSLREQAQAIMERQLDLPFDEQVVGTAPPVPISSSLSPVRRLKVRFAEWRAVAACIACD